jgi:hypothetical protein
MSTIWNSNKERERNTHLRVKEASWNVASLLSYLKSVGIAPHPPPPPPLRRLILATCFGILATQFGVSPRVRVANSRRFRGGGGLGSPLMGFLPNTRINFWLFLLSYLTYGPFSCWYFLLLKQHFFWYYFNPQVMDILCCVAQKAASVAQMFMLIS